MPSRKELIKGLIKGILVSVAVVLFSLLIVLLFRSIGFLDKEIHIELNTPCPSENPTRDEVKDCLVWVAGRYGLNVNNFVQTAIGESSLNINAVGDNGKALGVFQYHQPTWDLFIKWFKDYLPMDFTYNRESYRDQIILTGVSWGVADTLAARHFMAWRKVVGYDGL